MHIIRLDLLSAFQKTEQSCKISDINQVQISRYWSVLFGFPIGLFQGALIKKILPRQSRDTNEKIISFKRAVQRLH